MATAKVRKKRNYTRLFITLVVLTIFIVGLVNSVSYIYGLVIVEKPSIESLYDEVEMVIFEGETAWTIQSRLKGNETNYDLRQLLDEVTTINNRDNLSLVQGETVIFLKAKEQ